MADSSRRTEYLTAAGIAAVALAVSPPSILLITGRSDLTFRVSAVALALDVFLLVIAAALVAHGRARKLMFHLIAWTFPVALLAGLEAGAIAIRLADRIAAYEDFSLLGSGGRWPGHLMSDARWAPGDGAVRLYRPWQGDGIVINELGLRTASPTPKSAGEWRVAISGGSTVWGWRVLDADTIPASVQRLLRATHPNITVFNFGIEGARIAAELALLKRFRDVYAIDQVVFYTGVNDTFGTYGSSQDELSRLRVEGTAFELVKAARRVSAVLAGPSPEVLTKLDREVLPRMVRNNSLRPGVIAADDYCRAALLRCDFALQGILPTRKSPVGPEIRIAQTVERLFPRFSALNGQMYRDTIAAGPGLRIHDLTHLLDASDRPFFVDVAHMNEAGYRLVAEALVPIVLKGQAEAARAQQPPPTHSR